MIRIDKHANKDYFPHAFKEAINYKANRVN